MKNVIKGIGFIIAIIIMLDITGYILWSASNQKPQDGFYVGALSASVISSFK